MKTLSDAGITPDSSKTYTLDDIQSALSDKHGSDVTINCKSGAFNEVWYFYNIKGSVQTGEFKSAKPGMSCSLTSTVPTRTFQNSRVRQDPEI